MEKIPQKTMETNEIKKYLYKEKPLAELTYIRKGIAYYQVQIEEYTIKFEVPVNDMGDADFFSEMDAKLLIRYLVN